MKWFRSNLPLHQTDLAMIGAKAGQQALLLGAGDGTLAAAVAQVTGLNGRTLVVDRDDARAAVEAAAANAGTLVDFERAPLSTLPILDGTIDVAVAYRSLSQPNVVPAHILADTARVLRDGGRLIVIEGASAGFLERLRSPPAPAMPAEAVRALLVAAGFRAVRLLAEVGGVIYVEAAKRTGA